MTDTDLDGRTALVTGSTGGIGEAVARDLAEAGARIVVHGLEADHGRDLARTLGGRFVGGDLADPATPRVIASALAEEEHLDIIVNNAGMEIGTRATDLETEVLQRLWQVNVVAPTQLVRVLLPRLRERPGGAVVNVTSIHARVPVVGNIAYAMTKAALGMYTGTAALELAPLGIRVNAVAPGAIRTTMNADLIDAIGADTFASWVPLGRIGAPDDIAAAVRYLVSDGARYVTGTTLVVDGGYSENLVRYPGERS